MFGTILGPLPRPSLPDDASPDDLVAAALRAQEEAGLEPLVDGRLRWPSLGAPMIEDRAPSYLDAWRLAASLTSRAVKAVIPGPYSLARRLEVRPGARRATAMRLARALRAEIVALVDAGCPIVEVEESDAGAIGVSTPDRALFRDAHLALTDGVAGGHLSLALVGPSADTAGAETILAPPYASLAVDLIAGPDNWRIVALTPKERGIVAGVVPAVDGGDEGPEMPLYASRYAASTAGRGLARVGLATAAGLDRLSWEVAVRKIAALGRAVRVAGLPPGSELAAEIDPRAIDSRAAALGRQARGRPRWRR